MKYIDRLLQGAPVEWLPLGEVAEIKKGKQLNKRELLQDGLYPAYNGGVTYSGFTNTYNYPANTIIVSQGGASAGFVNFVTSKFYANAHCYVVLPDIERANNRYLYHVLKWSQNTLMQKQQGAGIPGLSSAKLLQTPIPIPPVAVQEEVVRVLDKFTALEAELEAELDCRKRQYGYYRDALLTFDLSPSDGLCHSPLFPAPFAVEWHPLGEVGEIYGGLTGKNKDDFKSGDALYIPYKNIFDNICVSSSHLEPVVVASTEKQNEVRYGDLLFTASSETPEEVGMSSAVTSHFETPVYLNSFCFGVRFNEDVTLIPEFSKFLFRSTQMRRQISRTASGVTRFNVSKSRFKKIEIPIPPLAVQERIVEILDKFDTLVNSISEGLPREIELRRKQYEYYRDALLSFEPLTSNL